MQYYQEAPLTERQMERKVDAATMKWQEKQMRSAA